MYIPREEEGMGIPVIDEIHKNEIIGLGEYLKGKGSRYLSWVKDHEEGIPNTKSIIRKSQNYLEEYSVEVRIEMEKEDLKNKSSKKKREGKLKIKIAEEGINTVNIIRQRS